MERAQFDVTLMSEWPRLAEVAGMSTLSDIYQSNGASPVLLIMIPSGTNLLKVKDYNMAIVLNLIRKFEPISRREISDRTGLSFQTVTNITQNLLHSGVILEGSAPLGNGVRQSRSLEINPNAAYAAGIHIDRAKLTIVLTNFEARVLWRTETQLTPELNTRSALPYIQQAINQAVHETGILREQLLGVGLAVPGPLDIEAGCLLKVPNLSDWANHPIRDELEALLNLPVVLDEDVTAIILGEQWCGLGGEFLNLVYVYVGIGIGIGIVANGHALRGWRGNIGHIGHIQIDPMGPPCHCGKRGCLEVYCTAEGILRDARIAAINRDHLASPKSPLLPECIEDVVGSDDPIFREVIAQAAKRLGAVLGQAVAVLDPELILWGGETLQLLGDDFMKQVIEEIPKSAMPSKPMPSIRRSSLGVNAGAIGAATLVLHDAYSPSIQRLNLI
jgi:predicted NBD/HSP70 family sugar kinase